MSHRSRPFLGLLSILLAALALISQLALGAMLLPDGSSASEVAAFDAVSVLCSGNHSPDDGDTTRHTHRPVDRAICPLSVALALPSIVPTPEVALPARAASVLVFRVRDRPPGRGPPLATARVGAPRAPPPTA
jgi:hypothetical protein